MTKFWRAAPLAEQCGFCGNEIPLGAPQLVRQLDESGVRKVRCANCAGEPVPTEMPTVAAADAAPSRSGMTAVGELRDRFQHYLRDTRSAAGLPPSAPCEREPGEDDE